MSGETLTVEQRICKGIEQYKANLLSNSKAAVDHVVQTKFGFVSQVSQIPALDDASKKRYTKNASREFFNGIVGIVEDPAFERVMLLVYKMIKNLTWHHEDSWDKIENPLMMFHIMMQTFFNMLQIISPYANFLACEQDPKLIELEFPMDHVRNLLMNSELFIGLQTVLFNRKPELYGALDEHKKKIQQRTATTPNLAVPEAVPLD